MYCEERPGWFWRFLGGLWRLLDGTRRAAVNLLFLLIALALMGAALAGKPKVPSSTALVIDPRGPIVEQLSTSPRDRILGGLTGSASQQETLLKDLLDAIHAGKDDARVKALFLDLDQMGRTGFSKLQDLRAAILDFKKSGKKVVAGADAYDQTQYYLAAHADEVFLHPMGLVLLEGFGGYRRHYKEGLDKLGVEMHIFRVGEYKSAVEPYLRNDMSRETKEALLEVSLVPGRRGGRPEAHPRGRGGDGRRLHGSPARRPGRPRPGGEGRPAGGPGGPPRRRPPAPHRPRR